MGEKVEEDISLKTVTGECQGRAKELKGITNEFVLTESTRLTYREGMLWKYAVSFTIT